MTATSERPLVSGLEVMGGRTPPGRRLEKTGVGTLTGLATRLSDNQKVLVTNLHVLADDQYVTAAVRITRPPYDDEEMYQGRLHADDKVGSGLEYEPLVDGVNQIDVAYVELDEGVAADFLLREQPTDDSDTSDSSSGSTDTSGTAEPIPRRIVAGAAAPVADLGNPMQLTMVGAFGGEGIVTVHRIGQETTIDGRDFENLVLLNCSQRPVHDGDSGSGCFAKMTEGEYRLSCIVFASMSGATSEHANYGWAFPAKTAEDKLSIVFGNRKPIADAGPTQAVTGGTLVTLDAGLSYDEDGDEVSYVWEQAPGVGGQGAGPLVQTPSPGRVTFTAPTGPAALTFKLTVTDQHGGVGTDETHVHVSVAPPRANAGPDQAIDTRYPVPLLAFFSRNCTYKWEQLPGGTRVELNNADKRYAWFTAPGGATTLRFRVTVTDRQGASDGDDMTVVVRNRPPGLVTAGDQIVSQGGPVALSGGGSDPDVDDIVTFKWEQLTGPPVELADADTPYATFTAPSRVANLGFQFTVADNHGASVSAIEVVRVR